VLVLFFLYLLPLPFLLLLLGDGRVVGGGRLVRARLLEEGEIGLEVKLPQFALGHERLHEVVGALVLLVPLL